MRERILEAIAVSTAISESLEFTALELTNAASAMADKPIANVLLASARQNRVEAMKVEARLAVLRIQYGKLYGGDCP